MGSEPVAALGFPGSAAGADAAEAGMRHVAGDAPGLRHLWAIDLLSAGTVEEANDGGVTRVATRATGSFDRALPGISGSPIIDATGGVISVVYGGKPGMVGGLEVDALRPLIAEAQGAVGRWESAMASQPARTGAAELLWRPPIRVGLLVGATACLAGATILAANAW